MEVRQAAGLLLKNNLKANYQAIAPAYQHYIKAELLPCLGSSDRHIRATVGTVISVVVQQVHVQGWPEIFQAIAQCLDSNDYNHMEGALDALSKVSNHFLLIFDDIVDHGGSVVILKWAVRPIGNVFAWIRKTQNTTILSMELNFISRLIPVIYISLPYDLFLI